MTKTILFAILIVAVGVIIGLRGERTLPSPTPLAPTSLIPSPPVSSPEDTSPRVSAPLPLAKGKQFFRVGGGGKNGPRFIEGFIDPYDPKIGARQMMSVTVSDTKPVTSVQVTMKTDNGSKTYDLALAGGTELYGLWQGSWAVNDTYEETYNAVIRATSERGTSQIEITLR